MNNIILIGMPGSGKSSVGRKLAKRLRRPLIDTDRMVEQAEGQSIPQLFAVLGEPYFRDVETRCVQEAAQMDGVIISTGGGVILRPENMETLKRSGTVFFLDRPPSKILARAQLGDRPLIRESRNSMMSLYQQRIGLYQMYADARIKNQRYAKQAVLKILAHCKTRC